MTVLAPPPAQRRPSSAALVLTLATCIAGCGGPRSLELSGAEMRRRLPEEVGAIVPAGAILCLDEEGQDGAYRVWILRKPGGELITFPGRSKVETHWMPTSAIETVLQARLPTLRRGAPAQRHCRYAHWRSRDGAEVQVREILTDQGWLATVERVRP